MPCSSITPHSFAVAVSVSAFRNVPVPGAVRLDLFLADAFLNHADAFRVLSMSECLSVYLRICLPVFASVDLHPYRTCMPGVFYLFTLN